MREKAKDDRNLELLEALFQATGFWQVRSSGTMGLPAAARSVRIHGHPGPRVGLEAVVSEGEGGTFDAFLRDEDGFVWVELNGYQTAALDG